MSHSALGETCGILADLVAFPTVSSESNLELIAYSAERLEAAGAKVEVDRDESGGKANLLATFGPPTDGGILLAGHTDVVPVDGQDWTSDPFRLVERDGRLHGRGACDMKGFLACALALAPSFATIKAIRPLHVALTYDEEVGCHGGEALVRMLASRGPHPALAIVGEPTAMRVIDAHKGCYEYTTLFRGRGGHASDPRRGVNAIDHACRFLTLLRELGDDLRERSPPGSPFDPPWTTLQAGRIEGGVARNVIAESCVVEWEMRPVCAEDVDFVRSALAAHFEKTRIGMRAAAAEAEIVTETVGEVDPLERSERSEARDLMLALTGENAAGAVPFVTEASLFQKAGMSAVVCGPGSIEQAHRPDEWIAIAQLDACLSVLERLAHAH